MKKASLLFFVLVTASCAWGPLEGTKLVLSLGESRSLINLTALPYALGDKLFLRVTSLDGMTVYAEKIYTSQSNTYRLEVENLSLNQVYRAMAFYMDGNNTVQYMDSRQFYLSGEEIVITLRLGHVAKINLSTPLYDYFLTSINPFEFQKNSLADQLDPGAKIALSIPYQHTPTLTSYEYRVNGGGWNSVSASAQPVISFPNFGIYTIQVRYRQESNGEWLVYTFVISHLI